MTKTRIGILTILIAIASVITVLPVRAQIMGPAIERHALELGYTFKWYERDFDTLNQDSGEWSAGAFYLRFGACRWATLSFEGGLWDVDHDDFPDNDYRRYVFGVGLTSLLYARERFELGVSGHYSEIFDHDRSQNQFHKNTRNITAAIQLQTSWDLERTTIELWGGPALIYDQSRQYPWQSNEPVRANTTGNFGIVVGVNFLFVEHISAFGYVAYADALQPRLGAGYRF
ncbi:MAG: hypothetical protein JSW50_15320 [Candidatus Latescibacterota bacterium]|nr:MAG: hypothetical protein JSW50_15320 [Candidatus Latescibacterota bacterium]